MRRRFSTWQAWSSGQLGFRPPRGSRIRRAARTSAIVTIGGPGSILQSGEAQKHGDDSLRGRPGAASSWAFGHLAEAEYAARFTLPLSLPSADRVPFCIAARRRNAETIL